MNIKSYLLVCVLLTSISLFAQKQVKVNGIYYDFEDSGNATVTYPENGNIYGYTGDVTIPPIVVYRGREYRVTEIDFLAFGGQEKLSSVSIPYTVNVIGDDFQNSFLYTPNLKNIYVDAQNTSYCSINGVLFTKSKSTIYCYPSQKSASSYKIPEGVERIHIGCFYKCKNLVSITLPHSIREIGDYAFEGCVSLNEVRYPSGFHIPEKTFPNTARLISYSVDPPLLALVNGTLSFSDQTGNKILDANEKCTIKFKIQNNGKGAAQNCEARVKLSGTTNGISVKNIKLPEIAVGQTYEVKFL